MWDFAVGVILGIYLGTYYDFRPGLEILMKWGGGGGAPRPGPPPADSAAASRALFSFLPTSSAEE